jgi:hypothetical protein
MVVFGKGDIQSSQSCTLDTNHLGTNNQEHLGPCHAPYRPVHVSITVCALQSHSFNMNGFVLEMYCLKLVPSFQVNSFYVIKNDGSIPMIFSRIIWKIQRLSANYQDFFQEIKSNQVENGGNLCVIVPVCVVLHTNSSLVDNKSLLIANKHYKSDGHCEVVTFKGATLALNASGIVVKAEYT